MEMTQVLIPYNNITEILNDLEDRFLGMKKVDTLKALEDSYVRAFNIMINRFLKSATELDAITLNDSNRNFNELLKIVKKALASFSKLEKDETAKNLDMKVLAHTLFVDANAAISDFKTMDIEVKQFVKDEIIPSLPQDVFDTLAKSFVVNRTEGGISVYDDVLNVGEKLLSFKKYTKASEVVAYGTDIDPEKAQQAKDNGVDNIAKLGIKKMSHNTFDIALYPIEKMTFLDTNSYFVTKDEVIEFGNFQQRRVTKNGGYLIFNIPYFRIPEFQSRLNHLRIEGIYRVDDEAGNMLFVTTFRKGDYLAQNTALRKAFMVPKKVPHYTEMEKHIIEKGELTLPELFKAKLYDERDHEAAFKSEINSLDFIESLYEPKEKVVEFNQSIQQLKIGHFPAVATIGVANGIYDTSLHKDVEAEYPHLFAAKIVQQEVSNSEEELENGKIVELVSIRKRNKNVFKALLPDGTVKPFLNA